MGCTSRFMIESSHYHHGNQLGRKVFSLYGDRRGLQERRIASTKAWAYIHGQTDGMIAMGVFCLASAGNAVGSRCTCLSVVVVEPCAWLPLLLISSPSWNFWTEFCQKEPWLILHGCLVVVLYTIQQASMVLVGKSERQTRTPIWNP